MNGNRAMQHWQTISDDVPSQWDETIRSGWPLFYGEYESFHQIDAHRFGQLNTNSVYDQIDFATQLRIEHNGSLSSLNFSRQLQKHWGHHHVARQR